jgi:hypothetical protein
MAAMERTVRCCLSRTFYEERISLWYALHN